jgi:hypothetical protein
MLTTFTPHDRFMLYVRTRGYRCPEDRRLAVSMAEDDAWQESPDCRSALLDVCPKQICDRLNISVLQFHLSIISLQSMGLVEPMGPIVDGVRPMRMDTTSVLVVDAPVSTAAIERLARGSNPLRDGDQVEGEWGTFPWERGAA